MCPWLINVLGACRRCTGHMWMESERAYGVTDGLCYRDNECPVTCGSAARTTCSLNAFFMRNIGPTLGVARSSQLTTLAIIPDNDDENAVRTTDWLNRKKLMKIIITHLRITPSPLKCLPSLLGSTVLVCCCCFYYR